MWWSKMKDDDELAVDEGGAEDVVDDVVDDELGVDERGTLLDDGRNTAARSQN